MTFLLIYIYLFFVFVRLHEYVPALANVSILPPVLATSFLFWLMFGKKSFEAPQYLLILFFTLCMSISVATSGWLGGAIFILNDFYPTVIVFFLLANSIDSNKKMRYLFLLFIIASFLTALHGILQAQNGIGWTGTTLIEGRIRYIGIFQDPNDLGLLFLISLPMLAYWFIYTKWLVIRSVMLGATGTILYGIYLTNSRGTVVSLGIMVFAWLYRQYGVVRACLVGSLLSPLYILTPSRLNELNASEESAFSRIEAWYEGFQMLKSNPLFGIGVNNFTDYHVRTAHNSYILVLAETGLISYISWFCFISLSLYMVYLITKEDIVSEHQILLKLRNSSNNEIKKISNTLFITFLGFLSCIFFLSRSYNIILYILCGMCVAHYQNTCRESKDFKKIILSIIYPKVFSVSVMSIIIMYVIVRILINTS